MPPINLAPGDPTLEERLALLEAELKNQRMVQAVAQTMNKHALVIQAFSVNFVTVFALFNGGAFTAFAALLPTEFGQAARNSYYPGFVIMMISFAVSFLLATGVLVAVFHYSLLKFTYYREYLNNKAPVEIPDRTTGTKFLLFSLFFSTAVGITCALFIMMFTEVIERQPATIFQCIMDVRYCLK